MKLNKSFYIFFFGLVLVSSLGLSLGAIQEDSVQTQPIGSNTLQKAEDPADYLWNVTWGGPGLDMCYGMARDSTGNIYIVGQTASYGAGSRDFALVKFLANGTRLFNVTWGGAAMDIAKQVAIAPSGNVYVAGWTQNWALGAWDFALVKFDPNGVKLWNVTWGGLDWEQAEGLSIDSSENIYVSGYTSSFGNGNEDVALVKFSSNGAKLWNVTWGDTGSDWGYRMTLDSSENPLVTAKLDSSGATKGELVLIKFDQNGNELWNSTWGGPESDGGQDVIVDSSGNIYVTGNSNNWGAGFTDLALVKFDSSGTVLWNVTWGGINYDYGHEMVFDNTGNLIVVGDTGSFGEGSTDLALLKFLTNGTLVWNITWGVNAVDHGWDLVFDDAGGLYVCGIKGVNNFDFALIKYQFPTNGIPGFELVYILSSIFALGVIFAIVSKEIKIKF